MRFADTALLNFSTFKGLFLHLLCVTVYAKSNHNNDDILQTYGPYRRHGPTHEHKKWLDITRHRIGVCT